MRSQNLFFFTGLLAVLVMLPALKMTLEYIITTASALTFGNVLLQFAPVYCRCPLGGHPTYKVRWGLGGKCIACRHHHADDQPIKVPQTTLSQLVSQLFQRFILRKPAHRIAFVCEAAPARKMTR